MIGASTGIFFKKDTNKVIKYFVNKNIKHIEICFLNPENLLKYEINDFVKNLKNTYFSIHSPTKNIFYENNKLSNLVLEKIIKLNDELNVNNVVFHLNNVKNKEYVLKKLKKFNKPIIIELAYEYNNYFEDELEFLKK